ncbi:MAG: DUF58 domain-containing protein [Flammeovirgaceae bacterium]
MLQTSRYWFSVAGVRWQLLITLAVFVFIHAWLKAEYSQDDSNLWLVMNLFLTFVLWTFVGLIVISLITAILSWAYFFHLAHRKNIMIEAKLGDGQKAEAGKVSLHISLLGNVIRPLLGTVRARLMFAEKKLSDIILLDTAISRPRHWWRQGIKGGGQTLLHDRGIYDVQEVIVIFSDMLGLLSLPSKLPFVQQLYTLPVSQAPVQIKSQPYATEEQTYRIDIPKRVEGEYVNYKEFEMGDNIHRIVWKIYAKSGQLVVRIPETKDPYASHLYFYASFFTSHPTAGAFESELLNVYKDNVRCLFEALLRNGYDVRLPHDQDMPKLSGVSEKKSELFQITAAQWQNQITPSSFIKNSNAAFVCLPSLVSLAEIEMLLKTLPASIPLVVIKLSEAIPSPFQFSVKDLFFKPEAKPTDHLRQPWLLSSLRRALIKNENEISTLLKTRDHSWLTTKIEFVK